MALQGRPDMFATKLATKLNTAFQLKRLNKNILLFYSLFVKIRFKIKYYERNRG
jgi:hypothetical protein